MKMLSSIIFFLIVALAVEARRPEPILGGANVKQYLFKYHAALVIHDQYACGAVLITERQLLSAAHCVDYLVLYDTISVPKQVVVGSEHLLSGHRYDLSRISFHKNFNTSSNEYYNHNIAVLHTWIPILQTPIVKYISLPTPFANIYSSRSVIASGYGYFSDKPELAFKLKQIMLRVTFSTMCGFILGDVTITNNQFCSIPERNIGCCYGDDGGPVVDRRRQIVLGIISVTPKNCHNGSPLIFTKISHYISYIQSEINYNPNNESTWTDHPAADFPLLSTYFNSTPMIID